MGLAFDDQVGVLPRDAQGNALQLDRGVTQFGVKVRPLGTIAIQLTAGSGAATWTYKDNGVAIMAPVTFSANLNTTAALIAVAINAFRLANPTISNWVATASTDTITLRQIRSGAAGTIPLPATGDAAGAPANSGNVSNDTDTWTEFVGGATFDGDLYYEMTWDGSLVLDAGVSLSKAVLRAISLYCDGQAFQYWLGGLRANAAATALIQGIPVASQTWEENIPWLGAVSTFTIKVASDEELLVKAKYF
jgi:hypothetical protein